MSLGLGISVFRGNSTVKWWDDSAKLAFDYQNNRYMIDGQHVTFGNTHDVTRGSDGLLDNTAGRWKLFGDDVARRTNRGLIVAPSVTAQPVNSSLAGAVIGKLSEGGALPDGWTNGGFEGSVTLGADGVEILAIGVERGLPYIDLRLVYENTSDINQFPRLGTPIISANFGEVWTLSCFYTKLAGAWYGNNNSSTFMHVAANGADGDSYPSASRGGELDTVTQLVKTFTVNKADPVTLKPNIIFFTVSPSDTVDVTVRISVPQLTKTDHVVSPIITTDVGTVFQAQDEISSDAIATTLAGMTRGILVIDVFIPHVFSEIPDPAIYPRIFSISDGTTDNEIGMYLNPNNNLQLYVVDDSDLTASILALSSIAAGRYKMSIGFDRIAGAIGISINVGTELTANASLSALGLLNKANLGAREDGLVKLSNLFHSFAIQDEDWGGGRLQELSGISS